MCMIHDISRGIIPAAWARLVCRGMFRKRDDSQLFVRYCHGAQISTECRRISGAVAAETEVGISPEILTEVKSFFFENSRD